MNVFKKNLSWILVGNIAHAVLQFGLNIYCARILGSFSFGILNYCASLIAFFTAIGTLGYDGVITKLFADDEKDVGFLSIFADFIFFCRFVHLLVPL